MPNLVIRYHQDQVAASHYSRLGQAHGLTAKMKREIALKGQEPRCTPIQGHIQPVEGKETREA